MKIATLSNYSTKGYDFLKDKKTLEQTHSI